MPICCNLRIPTSHISSLTRLDPLPDRLLDRSDPLPDAEFFLELARDDALEPDALDEAREARDARDDARDERLLARDDARELARELVREPWNEGHYIIFILLWG